MSDARYVRVPDGEGNLGKYDYYSKLVQHMADAAVVVLIVVNGEHGDGMSVTCVDPKATLKLPGLLRHLADQIEAQNKVAKGK